MAHGVTADLHRWPGFRAQMEYGLDARHAALLRGRPGSPQVPSCRAHLLSDLRFPREFCASAFTRRSGARQGLAYRENARRHMAKICEFASALRLHVES